MYLIAAHHSYFSLDLPPKTRFLEYGSLLLIGQFEERNAELERAAVCGEDRCVTTLITAAKETKSGRPYHKGIQYAFHINFISKHHVLNQGTHAP